MSRSWRPVSYPTSARCGFSLIELLIVIAILGILLALAFSLRAPVASVFARDVQALYQQARLEAVKRNRPVAVVWDAAAGRLEARVSTGAPTVGAACAGDVLVRGLAPNEYGRVVVTADFAHGGAVWLPSTLMRGCAGPATSAQTLTIDDSRRSVAVRVSTTGEVSVR
jgi:prepilin-type N-terminal cleavage/methylation domain-containing protein